MLTTTRPSYADDDAVEVTWLQHDVDAESCWQQRCQVMLVMTLSRRLGCGVMSVPRHIDDGLPRRLGHDTMSVSSHVGDHAIEVTWPRRDVGVDDHANVTPSLIRT
jgi:hypothetical protein